MASKLYKFLKERVSVVDRVDSTSSISNNRVIIDLAKSVHHTVVCDSAAIIDITGFIDGNREEVVIELVNAGSFTLTFPANMKWLNLDGTLTSTLAETGLTFQSNGNSDFMLVFSSDGGANMIGKLLR